VAYRRRVLCIVKFNGPNFKGRAPSTLTRYTTAVAIAGCSLVVDMNSAEGVGIRAVLLQTRLKLLLIRGSAFELE
jgi:hypothetical protein